MFVLNVYFFQSMELTSDALEFLKGVFSMFDSDNVCVYFVHKIFKHCDVVYF